jgi:hypothetical protein
VMVRDVAFMASASSLSHRRSRPQTVTAVSAEAASDVVGSDAPHAAVAQASAPASTTTAGLDWPDRHDHPGRSGRTGRPGRPPRILRPHVIATAADSSLGP